MLAFCGSSYYSTYIAEILSTLSQQKERIVEIATDLIGAPAIRYVHGHPELGQSPESGFDCSGFVSYVLHHAGLYIPDYIGADGAQRPIRHANEYWDHYGIPLGAEPESGDLVFFSRNGLFPGHIGVVRDPESYIHSPGKDNTEVTISPIELEIIPLKHGARRILYETNPIGYKVPTKAHHTPTYRYHQQQV